MRTICKEAYSVKELKELFPEGFKRALSEHEKHVSEWGIGWQSEIFDSLKAVISHAGYSIEDYSLLMESYYNKFRLSHNEYSDDLTGVRALKWIENNFLSPLRIPFAGKRRYDVRKYGHVYRPGLIPPCPLTGVCFDDDFIDCFIKAVKSGETIRDALISLADEYSRMVQAEYEYEISEENFLEHSEVNDYEYYETGEMV